MDALGEFCCSTLLWMLLTCPAYWGYQWLIEGEQFRIL
jgi:hypothetical protein